MGKKNGHWKSCGFPQFISKASSKGRIESEILSEIFWVKISNYEDPQKGSLKCSKLVSTLVDLIDKQDVL